MFFEALTGSHQRDHNRIIPLYVQAEAAAMGLVCTRPDQGRAPWQDGDGQR
jgi:hypothetical protein